MKKPAESCRRGKREKLKQSDISVTPEMTAELEQMQQLAEEDIQPDPDIRNIMILREGVRGKFYRPVKTSVSIRLDADMLHWFKANYKPYQTKMNQILRSHMMDELRQKAR